ncbi:MAG TPA: CAP domain-containing protein [Deinococcales bacterium]|nr:CAP domain-containing protein [Deinococcales bacterium]
MRRHDVLRAALALLAAGLTAPALAAPTPLETQVIALINTARAAGRSCPGWGGGQRLGPVALDARLNAAAREHAASMSSRNYISHYEPDGSSPSVRVQRAGFRPTFLSEIIYMHSVIGGNPNSPVNWWLNSPVHCRAIMDPHYNIAGVGYSALGKSWTVLLAKR